MAIEDPAKCLRCADEFAASCGSFCPGQVYRWDGEQVVHMSWGFDLGEKTILLMLLMSATFFMTEYVTAQHFVQRSCGV